MSETEVFNKLPQWEQTQYKAFRNWVNINLSSVKSSIKALESDFKSGTKLDQLTEIIQKKSIGKWNKEPKIQMQELENLNIAIQAIQKDGVKLVNIGSTDIIEGNLKIILGLIWTLIQHYHINQLDFLDEQEQNQNTEGGNKNPQTRRASVQVSGLKKLNAKDKLLVIINEIIKPWGYVAKNFTTDFEDGRILQCLGHTRQPSTIRCPTKLGNDKVANVNEALEGFDKFGIPRVMDAHDIAERHDEKAMMTLLGYVLKEIANRDQLAYGPGQIITSGNEEEEEVIEESSNVHSSKKETSTTTTDSSDLPKIKVDRKALFTRFVEIGRIVYINYGEYDGKIAAILDVIDANSVIISGPSSGVPRTPISLKRLQLTDISVPIRRNPRQKTLEKAWNAARVQELWESTSWGKKLENRKRKAGMNDFDRFKALVAHQQRAKLIRTKRREMVPNKKSKK